MVARDGAHRELAIVGRHGACPHEHSVDQSPQAVQVLAIRFSGHETGISGPRGDEPIQALPQLADHQARAGLDQWSVAQQQRFFLGR